MSERLRTVSFSLDADSREIRTFLQSATWKAFNELSRTSSCVRPTASSSFAISDVYLVGLAGVSDAQVSGLLRGACLWCVEYLNGPSQPVPFSSQFINNSSDTYSFLSLMSRRKCTPLFLTTRKASYYQGKGSEVFERTFAKLLFLA